MESGGLDKERLWKTSLNLVNSEAVIESSKTLISKKKRMVQVRFDSAVRVILIPTRKEYRSAGLSDALWWKERDYSSFKGSAIMELRVVLSLQEIDPRAALKQLYQPENMLVDHGPNQPKDSRVETGDLVDYGRENDESAILESDGDDIRVGSPVTDSGDITPVSGADSATAAARTIEHTSYVSPRRPLRDGSGYDDGSQEHSTADYLTDHEDSGLDMKSPLRQGLSPTKFPGVSAWGSEQNSLIPLEGSSSGLGHVVSGRWV